MVQRKKFFGIDQLSGYQKALDEKTIKYDESLVFDGYFQAEKRMKQFNR